MIDAWLVVVVVLAAVGVMQSIWFVRLMRAELRQWLAVWRGYLEAKAHAAGAEMVVREEPGREPPPRFFSPSNADAAAYDSTEERDASLI